MRAPPWYRYPKKEKIHTNALGICMYFYAYENREKKIAYIKKSQCDEGAAEGEHVFFVYIQKKKNSYKYIWTWLVAERQHCPDMHMKNKKKNEIEKEKIHKNMHEHGSWERAPPWYAYEKRKNK